MNVIKRDGREKKFNKDKIAKKKKQYYQDNKEKMREFADILKVEEEMTGDEINKILYKSDVQ